MSAARHLAALACAALVLGRRVGRRPSGPRSRGWGAARPVRRLAAGAAGPLLRDLPQRPHADGGAGPRRARRGRGGGVAGGVGDGGPQAAGGGHAPGAAAAAGRGDLRPVRRLAGGRAGPARRREPRPRPDRGVPPAEPDRVPPRGARPPRPGDRRRGAAAGRRRELRLRQHRGGARGLADPARALPRGGAQDRPRGGRAPRALGHRRGVPPRERPAAGRPGGGHAVRHARRRRVPPHVPGGRRVRLPRHASPATPATTSPSSRCRTRWR